MSVNKKIDEKELEKVAGGGSNGTNDGCYTCPNCGYKDKRIHFNPETVSNGCDHDQKILVLVAAMFGWNKPIYINQNKESYYQRLY